MDRYETKRWLLSPVTAIRRRRANRLGPINRAVFEAHAYRPSMRRFFFAAKANPHILVGDELSVGAVVLDVGGYEGMWSERVLRRAGDREMRIVAFEPEPGAVGRFHARVDDPRVELYSFGLGGRDRRERLAISGPGSSVYSEPGDLGSTEVDLRDVDAVLASLDIDRIDLAKINIEGGEFELLDRLYETGRLAHIGTLIVQFHEFAPNAHRARRRNRRQLAETHRCTWNYAWVYERWDLR